METRILKIDEDTIKYFNEETKYLDKQCLVAYYDMK